MIIIYTLLKIINKIEEIEELINILSTLPPKYNIDAIMYDIFLEEMRVYYDDIRDEVYDEAIRVIKNRIVFK